MLEKNSGRESQPPLHPTMMWSLTRMSRMSRWELTDTIALAAVAAADGTVEAGQNREDDAGNNT